MHVYVYVYVSAYVYVHVYVYTYIYMYMYILLHVCQGIRIASCMKGHGIVYNSDSSPGDKCDYLHQFDLNRMPECLFFLKAQLGFLGFRV